MSEIKLFKLITNEEIIAKVISENDWELQIDDVVAVIYQQSEKGVSSGFAPFMPHSEGIITLYMNSIVGVGKVHPEVLKNYNTLFSNIVVPNSKIVV